MYVKGWPILALIISVILGCDTPIETSGADREESSGELVFQEQHRPQIHFSPKVQWTNDPNGMVYFEGEYHLFFQHYPDSNVWGPMHWGHAVSPDLVHWEELPIALYPDSLGYIFSGSAVVDWQNSSGLGSEGQPPLVAIYTYHDDKARNTGSLTYQTQGIAYSIDKGRTWAKYEGNPVIQNPGIEDFRDPKVIWDAAREQWVMVLAVQDHTSFYGSKDLKTWTFLSDFGSKSGNHGGVWECPDLFLVAVEETGEQKWVLLLSINPGGPNGGSATQYFVGDFDGTYFTLDEAFQEDVSEEQAVWLDYGKDNYAGVTWSDIPEEDGRRIFIGWMSNWQYAREVPTTIWRNAMTIPRSLSLVKEEEGYRLRAMPVEEVNLLAGTPVSLDHRALETSILPGDPPEVGRFELSFDAKSQGIIGLELSNEQGETLVIGWNAEENTYLIDRQNSGNTQFNEAFVDDQQTALRTAERELPVKMTILLDMASVELFADDGKTVMTSIHFPTSPFSSFRILSKTEEQFLEGTWTPMNSIWN